MRRRTIAVILAILAFGLVAASAATLDVTSSGVGAGTGLVASCDDAVTVDYTFTGSNVTGVTISDIAAACDGKDIAVSLLDGAVPPVPLGSDASDTLPNPGTGSFSIVVPNVSAASLGNVSIIISG
jgi:hypothetical protein